MRVVFFGTPAFAVPSLHALLAANAEIAAVVTQPDRPHARSHSTLVAPPAKLAATEAGIPVWQPTAPRGDTFYAGLRALRADLGVVVAYGHLLRPELLAIPRLGLVNVHASLLPRWRGAAPIQWSLLAGDRETGVAIMRVEAGLDTGAVWHTRATPVGVHDTAGSITNRLSQLGAQALIEALPRIAAGEHPVPQDDSAATLAPKITRDFARIRWDESAELVSCRVRAMDPAPGAWTTLAGTELKIWSAFAADDVVPEPALPGTIVAAEPEILVATGRGVVSVATVQPAGKRRMPASEWWRGAALPSGTRFA